MGQRKAFRFIIYLAWIAFIAEILSVSTVSRWLDSFIGFPLFNDSIEVVFVAIPAFCIFFYSKLLTQHRKAIAETEKLKNELIEANSTVLESEKNLRAILENSEELLWSMDMQHRLVMCNRSFEDEIFRLSGKRPVIGEVHFKLFSEDIQQFWAEKINRVLAGGTEKFDRSHMLNGVINHYQTSIIPMRVDGVIVGASCSVVDVTERTVAEERLRRSLDRFLYASKATNEVIWEWNLETDKLYWSENYGKQYGYDEPEIEEASETRINRIIDRDRQRVVEELRAAIADPGTTRWHGEYNYIKASGEVVVIEDQAYILRNPSGKAVSMIGAMDDVTMQKRAQRKIQQFNKELEAKVEQRTEQLKIALDKEREMGELRTRFISLVSHEFRTPLTVIMSSTELLDKYYSRIPEEQRKEHFKVVKGEIANLVSMLNDVLTLGKSSSGNIKFNPAPIQMSIFLNQILSRMNAVDTAAHIIKVQNNLAADNVVLDEGLMTHVLSNLISNALKYSEAGAPIYLELDNHNDKIRIQIRDEGIGIPEKDLENLFQPFHRASNVGAIQGTGLGLSIVREYVTLHNGDISVKNNNGRGTTFTIEIPQTDNVYEEQIG